MPNTLNGLSKAEINELICLYVGRSDAQFKNFVNKIIPLAEFRFCAMHDWSFLKKTGLKLPIYSTTSEYSLVDLEAPNGVLYTIQSFDIESIFSPDANRTLERVTLNDIRKSDPDQNDEANVPTAWAPIGDLKIKIYPEKVKDGLLLIDGKILPPPLESDTSYPTIPYKYQESFILYVLATVLDRENDDRAMAKKQEALLMIREDIKKDMEYVNGSNSPRLKHWSEVFKIDWQEE